MRPEHRGTSLGKWLIRTVLETAAHVGYECVRLDTTPSMTEAIRLYETLGFTIIAPYRSNPIEGTMYLEIEVGGEGKGKPAESR